MERDFVGYGEHPQIELPNGARVAVSIVVNYEEGSELAIGSGDATQESSREYPKTVPEGVRDLTNESAYEYGTRAGIWRILRLLHKHDVKATFFCAALALERHPEAARRIVEDGHEVCCHGYRWQEQYLMEEDEERRFIAAAVDSIEKTTSIRPVGWYSRYGPSVHTRELLAEHGGFIYDSDSLADDLPYYANSASGPFLVVPYTLEINDMKFWQQGTFGSPGDFESYMRNSFELLYEEGAECPRMMTVGLHLRIAGRPARSRALDRFLEHVTDFPDVWLARRCDIAEWWLAHSPPSSQRTVR